MTENTMYFYAENIDVLEDFGKKCEELLNDVESLADSLTTRLKKLTVKNKKFEDSFFNSYCEISQIVRDKPLIAVAYKLKSLYEPLVDDVSKLTVMYNSLDKTVLQLVHPIQYLTEVLPAGATTDIWKQLDGKNGYSELVRQQKYCIRCTDNNKQFRLQSLNSYNSVLKRFKEVTTVYTNIINKTSDNKLCGLLQQFIELVD